MKFALLLLAACTKSMEHPDATPAIDAFVFDDAGHVDDGVATRKQCTSHFTGTLPDLSFGRMDGYLRAIVPVDAHDCNGDSNHIHLQVEVMSTIYDIAVDVTGDTGDDVHTTTRDIAAMPGGPWTEGFHTGVLNDYISLAMVHSVDMPLFTKQQMIDALNADLATANHISIFAIPYGPDGAHLVHRNGSGHDGMIVTEPLSSPAHARLLSFTGQSF